MMVPKEYYNYVEQQRLLLKVTHQIASSVGLEETLPHILDGLERALKADGVRLLVNGAENPLAVYATGARAGAMASADDRILELVSEQGEIEISQDSGMGRAGLPVELATVIAVPLVAHDAQHGVLWLGFDVPHEFGDGERTFLAILAGQAALAIANARSFEAARKRREWLAAILANTPDPVMVVDREYHLQLLNPAAQEMFPTLTQAAIGQPLGQIEQTAGLVDLLRDYEDGVSSDDAQAVIEFTAENGRVYSPSVSDVQTERGDMAGWVLVLRDISHFKRLHDNMSDFLSTVSHDMRSPLTFMKGYLDMIGMVGELNAKQGEFVEKIVTGVNQMSDMVEKILEAGKLDPMTGTYRLLREPCDVVEVIEKALAGLAEPASKKELVLTRTIASGIPVVNVDKGMLTSAFTNLLENAVKYTPNGGSVDVELSINGDELVFRVADDGYGISPDNQQKLFQRNVRIHRKEWKRVKGSGLGLFIVKNVAQRHGGDAWVESIEGRGSTFYLSIPLEGPNLVGSEPGAAD